MISHGILILIVQPTFDDFQRTVHRFAAHSLHVWRFTMQLTERLHNRI